MAKNIGWNSFLVTVALVLQACGGGADSSGGDGAGGRSITGAGGAAPTEGTGGVPPNGGMGAGGGAIGSGGSAPSGGAGASGTSGGAAGSGGSPSSGVDLSGTWIAKVSTLATETAPLLGSLDANLDFVISLVVSHAAAGTLSMRFDVCKLATVTTPDPKALTVTFTPAVTATLSTTASESAPFVNVGDSVPIPALTILSGIDTSGNPIDADSDSLPGVTLPGNTGGILPVNVYAGMTIQASLTPKLTDPDTMGGTATFGAVGKIFGSDNPLLSSGDITVVTKMRDIPFAAKRLAGDVPCSEALKQFP